MAPWIPTLIAALALFGTTAGDRVGGGGVVALSDGSYVVASPDWDNGASADAGAATFGSGTGVVTGAVSPANSLVGDATGQRVAAGGTSVLGGGNCVVASPQWDDGATADVGAATYCRSSPPSVGVVTT